MAWYMDLMLKKKKIIGFAFLTLKSYRYLSLYC